MEFTSLKRRSGFSNFLFQSTARYFRATEFRMYFKTTRVYCIILGHLYPATGLEIE